MTQKIALVTGASSGIGRATAQLLAKNGYYVFAAARRMHRLEQIRSERIEPVRMDVADAEAIQKQLASTSFLRREELMCWLTMRRSAN